MNTPVFGTNYANVYDTLYNDKDYDGEVALIDRLFQQYARQPVKRVLDLGCGTGNHAFRLAAKGYEVVGVDRSAEMLQLAKAKASGLPVRFHQSSVAELKLAEKFDAALLMFAVLGYHTENRDVLAALRAIRQHLVPGGLLAFDVWYGPGVLTDRPGDRVRRKDTGATTLLRTTATTLDTTRHVCTVRFNVWQFENDKVIRETDESHVMRYFFPQELNLFLEVTGFQLRRLGVFPDFDKDPDDKTWNVMAVAEAV